MRAYEVVMRSGAKNEVMAEVLHDDPGLDDKIYFYRDKCLKQLVAYFLREEVAGIILGPENPAPSRATNNSLHRGGRVVGALRGPGYFVARIPPWRDRKRSFACDARIPSLRKGRAFSKML